MKRLTIYSFLNQRKPLSHLLYILITLLGLTVLSLQKGTAISVKDQVIFFFLVLIQLEVFISVARLIFKEMDTNLTGKELTRIVLIRFVFFIIICFIAAFIIIIVFKTALVWISGGNVSAALKDFMDYEFVNWLKSTLFGLSIGAIIFIIIQWQDALKREQKLREENLIFQNETLKAQINPHFLFNSLNTISSLIQTHPGSAEKFINNLSLFYRYILENGQKDRVPLQSELDFISGYFNLHRIRDEEKIVLDIENVDTDSYTILPVSLQILIENAIKHNIATRDNPLRISIYIENNDIVVKNNLQKKASQLKSTQVGLKNLSERVRLVSGRTLIIEETNNYFTVKMPLLK